MSISYLLGGSRGKILAELRLNETHSESRLLGQYSSTKYLPIYQETKNKAKDFIINLLERLLNNNEPYTYFTPLASKLHKRGPSEKPTNQATPKPFLLPKKDIKASIEYWVDSTHNLLFPKKKKEKKNIYKPAAKKRKMKKKNSHSNSDSESDYDADSDSDSHSASSSVSDSDSDSQSNSEFDSEDESFDDFSCEQNNDGTNASQTNQQSTKKRSLRYRNKTYQLHKQQNENYRSEQDDEDNSEFHIYKHRIVGDKDNNQ